MLYLISIAWPQQIISKTLAVPEPANPIQMKGMYPERQFVLAYSTTWLWNTNTSSEF